MNESHWNLRNLVRQRQQSFVREVALRRFVKKDYCYLMTFNGDCQERFGVFKPTLFMPFRSFTQFCICVAHHTVFRVLFMKLALRQHCGPTNWPTNRPQAYIVCRHREKIARCSISLSLETLQFAPFRVKNPSLACCRPHKLILHRSLIN